MVLDYKKSRTFSCSECGTQLINLRNCLNLPNKKAKNFINGEVYTYCPKRVYITSPKEKLLVELYMDCRESKTLPYPGPLTKQTNFTRELFVFLDEIVSEWRDKRQEEMNKASQTNRSK